MTTTKKDRKTMSESIVREIKRKTRRKFTAEEKIRIVLDGLRGEASITDLCRKSPGPGSSPECFGSAKFGQQLIFPKLRFEIRKPS